MTTQLKVQGFYESFIAAIYGFILVFGFEHFVSLQSGGKLTLVSYILFATSYITLLHFWLVFFAATEETFELVFARESESAKIRMVWFWAELLFTTIFSLPMLQMFASVHDVASFTRAMAFIALLSLLWDLWAFAMERFISRHDSKAVHENAKLLLLRWTGLDLLFLSVTILMLAVVKSNGAGAQPLNVALSLFGISALGSVLDTVIINPGIFLSKKQ